MKSADLSEEYWKASFKVRQNHLNRLAELGCPISTLAQLGEHQPSLGVARIDILKDGLFAPSETGAPAFIQPVCQWDDDWGIPDIIDLVAWLPSNPTRWYWRVGTAAALGAEHLDGDDPVPVVASPLEWLSASGDAVAILDWSPTSPIWRDLRFAPPLQFKDSALRTRVRNAMILAAPMPQMELTDAS